MTFADKKTKLNEIRPDAYCKLSGQPCMGRLKAQNHTAREKKKEEQKKHRDLVSVTEGKNQI